MNKKQGMGHQGWNAVSTGMLRAFLGSIWENTSRAVLLTNTY